MLAADLAGVAVFAAEGALVAIDARLDLLGIAVIAFTMGLGGGILRDVLLGEHPPAALRDRRYALAVLAATIAAVALRPALHGMGRPLLVLDAAGLALFATAGTEKALDAGQGAVAAIILGTLTAVGGGAINDVLLARVPAILRIDFYASAALAGAAMIVAARHAGLSPRASALTGGLTCLALRLLGATLHWHLPVFTT